jgi:hypothetical protein
MRRTVYLVKNHSGRCLNEVPLAYTMSEDKLCSVLGHYRHPGIIIVTVAVKAVQQACGEA